MATPFNIIQGTAADDNLTGTSGRDFFELQQGGNDTVSGLDGDDVFNFAASLTAADVIDGGTGNDLVRISGEAYGDGLVLAAGELTNVEKIQFGDGFDYNVTSADMLMNKGTFFTVDGASVHTGSVIFDGSGEHHGQFRMIGGAGDDTLTGGSGGDIFIAREGGQDIVHGGDGNDSIVMGGTLDASDELDGGKGHDTVVLQGIDAGDSLTLSATSLTSIEKLVLQHGFDYDITGNDGNIAAHTTLVVENVDQDPGASQFVYDGSAETDGHFHFKPELSNATLIGGAQSDTFDLSGGQGDSVTGGGGADLIIANTNADETFTYNAASDSTGIHYDTIRNVNFANDTFVAPWGTMGVPDLIKGGLVAGGAHFDADLGSVINDSLTAHGAVLFTADAGSLNGHSYLVIDVNGAAGYQAGQDLVIDVTGYGGLNT
jgi:Ca2+-binding RTX toxin-like protein